MQHDPAEGTHLRYAASVDGIWAVVRFHGGGYSRRKYRPHSGWGLLPHDEEMPPAVERELCSRLGIPCKLDPTPLPDAPYIVGDWGDGLS